jgi:hypothetical protein
MRKLAMVCVAAVALCCCGFVTENESLVSGVLTTLHFEKLPPENPKVVGGEPHFKITEQTIEFLSKHKGRTIVVSGNGSIAIK